MKLIRLLALLIGIFVTPAAIDGAGLRHTDSDANHFRVMTFNIRYDEPRDKENAWPNRKELVASMIRFHHADLVGVQETLRRQLDDLSNLLPEYGWVGVGRADGKNEGEFSAILYRTSRFKVTTSGTFWLSETPNVRGSKGWDSSFPRIVTWAQFKDQKTGKTLFHFNTHFDHRGERARLESARLLRQQIVKIAGTSATVVTGDFNFNEASEGYRLLTAQENKSGTTLRDSRYLSRHGHHGPTSTFNEFKALIPSMKIDFILVKEGIEVLQHGVLSDTWDGRFPSDHLPVLAEVLLN
jgi:endonuclease/exonuclease/phosphatase family metal-dependent hydrolase